MGKESRLSSENERKRLFLLSLNAASASDTGTLERQDAYSLLHYVAALIPISLSCAEVERDPFQKTKALSTIAQAQYTLDDQEGAPQTLAKAHIALQTISDSHFNGLASLILVSAEASAHHFAEVVETAQQIDDPYFRSLAYKDIALLGIASGNRDQARVLLEQSHSIAATIDSGVFRDFAFEDIALAYAASGEFAAALVMANGIIDSAWQAEAFGGIAMAQAKAGAIGEASWTLTQAREIIALLRDEVKKARTVVQIAPALATLVGVKEAITEVVALTDKGWQARGYSAIAGVLAEQGNVQEARRILQTALEVTDKIQFEGSKLSALLSIATTQALIGDLEAAQTTAEIIRDDHGRSTAYVRIAVQQIKENDFAGATGNVQRAIEAATAIPYAASKAWTLADITLGIAHALPNAISHTATGASVLLTSE